MNDKIYKVRLASGERVPMAYKKVCYMLGFMPSAHFVRITTAGTISFTVGKPNEIRLLLDAVEKSVFVPASGLKKAEIGRAHV